MRVDAASRSGCTVWLWSWDLKYSMGRPLSFCFLFHAVVQSRGQQLSTFGIEFSFVFLSGKLLISRDLMKDIGHYHLGSVALTNPQSDPQSPKSEKVKVYPFPELQSANRPRRRG